jgi:membrane-associated phospholipid phosphatase
VTLFAIALAGLRRIYLEVHFLSEVLAAIAESSAWIALSFTALNALLPRRDALPAID